jgi:hypothetical protein
MAQPLLLYVNTSNLFGVGRTVMILSRSDGDEPITIRGVIIAVDWDENGSVTAVAVSAHDEEEYVIEQGEDLLEFIREEVEITGVPRKEHDRHTVISIKKLRLLGSSGESAAPSVIHRPGRNERS